LKKEEILEHYDKEQRRDLQVTGMRREVTEKAVRHVSLSGDEGSIIYSKLNSEDVAATVREQIAYFENLKQNFEWKYYAHDEPDDLLEHLLTQGFTIEDREALLVLDLQRLPEKLKQSTVHDVRLLQQPEELKDVLTIETSVWGGDQTDIITYLAENMKVQPELLRVYVAYHDDKPASSAWMFLNESSQFASLWGGSTIKEYRGLGFYTALVAARAQEAIKHGARFLTVDASPMSQPILEKLGFQFLTHTYPCKWTLKKS
jgi:GNAT superfamily N-acetyltransferase